MKPSAPPSITAVALNDHRDAELSARSEHPLPANGSHSSPAAITSERRLRASQQQRRLVRVRGLHRTDEEFVRC